jgi:iron complex transport system permease protein
MTTKDAATSFRWIWAGIGLAGVFLSSFMIGRFPVAPHHVVAILASQLLPIDPSWTTEAATIVLKVRLPRILSAMLVGAALSSSGAAFQGVFRNPMVSPDILGVAAGAGFGAALAILAGMSGLGIQAAAFVGGLIAVTATYAIGSWRGSQGDGVLVMVLAGIIVGTVFSAGISLTKYVADPANTLPAITFWLMGSLASVTSRDLCLVALPILSGLCLLNLLRWRLNLLSFGDDEARALGVDVRKIRLAVIVAATLMTASSVAISGVIGLVGLVVPHLARMLVGPNYRILLPTCALLGAGFLLAVDDLARSLAAGEIPLGILTSLLGAPFFLALLFNIRKGWAT